MVQQVRLELTHPHERRNLNPVRLPITPLLHLFGGVEENRTLYRKGANLPRYLSTCYPILFGAKGWDRTTDTRLRRPPLFHLSYSRNVLVQGVGNDPTCVAFQTTTNPSQLTLQNWSV